MNKIEKKNAARRPGEISRAALVMSGNRIQAPINTNITQLRMTAGEVDTGSSILAGGAV